MKSIIATQRIIRQLEKCEQGADQLLADTATLVAEMATARLTTDAASGTGQRALSRAVAAQKAVVEAQQDLIRAHLDLLKIGQERGDIADGECPPSTGAFSIAA